MKTFRNTTEVKKSIFKGLDEAIDLTRNQSFTKNITSKKCEPKRVTTNIKRKIVNPKSKI